MSVKKCLVLGANGFIGSHIVDDLVDRGYEVIAFDRFSHEPQFFSSPKVEIIKGDFFDNVLLGKLLYRADYLIHAFSATNPFTADNDPYSDIRLTILQNVEIFDSAIKNNIKKIAYISSGGAVYGDVPKGVAVSEESPTNPISPYGIGKLTTERYLAYFNRKHQLDYTVYRLTNPYGPRQRYKNSQGVIPMFMAKISAGEPITMLGDGSSSRDYIYIRDATSMIITSLFGNARSRVYNIGSGKQTSLRTIVTEIEKIAGKKAKIHHIEPPKTFPHRTDISISTYIRDFGVPALRSLSEGLHNTFSNH